MSDTVAYVMIVALVVLPAYGLIRYPQRTYRIDYTAGLEKQLKDLLDEIRVQKRKRVVNRSSSTTDNSVTSALSCSSDNVSE